MQERPSDKKVKLYYNYYWALLITLGGVCTCTSMPCTIEFLTDNNRTGMFEYEERKDLVCLKSIHGKFLRKQAMG